MDDLKEKAMEIDTTSTTFPVCPRCGEAHEDAYEWGRGGEEGGEMECYKCGYTFVWERTISVEYTTYERAGNA